MAESKGKHEPWNKVPKYKSGQMVQLVNGCRMIVFSGKRIRNDFFYSLSYRDDPDHDEVISGFSEDVLSLPK